MEVASQTSTIEKWGVFEFALQGYQEGNPFIDYDIKGTFQGKFKITLPGKEYMAVRIRKI